MDKELLQKTKEKKSRGIMVAAVLIAFCVIGFIGFRVFGPGEAKPGATGEGTVTVTIECKDLAADMDALTKPELKKYIPEDGVILDKEKYEFQKDETVYDALEAVCLKNDVHLETSEDALYKSRYIEGIGYLYEKNAGKNSGWLFLVDGDSPNYGASKVKLKDKQDIVWHYTIDYEKDDKDM